jgi:hypothetical protein
MPTQSYEPATGFIMAVGPLDTEWSAFGQIVVFDKTFGNLQLTEIPEPASINLMASGLAVIVILKHRPGRRGGAP